MRKLTDIIWQRQKAEYGLTPRLLLPLILMMMMAHPAQAQDHRTALVIGNSAYSPPHAYLPNPVNDAEDIAEALRRCGFKVITVLNAGQPEMQRRIQEFGAAMPKEGVALFYYAGHGLQHNGENYLAPIDTQSLYGDEVATDHIQVSSVLEKMAQAGNRLNIIILDACRTRPLSRSAGDPHPQGWARMDAPSNSIIAYATAPGSVAFDGTGRNGVYTSALLSYLEAPGMEIGRLFREVRINVLRDSGKRQVPWESSSLTEDFYFVPGQFEPIRGVAIVGRHETSVRPMPPIQGTSRTEGPPDPPEVALKRPRLMVLIEEEYSGVDVRGMRLAETEISARLTERAFELVDQSQYAEAGRQDQARQVMAGNPEAAQALGLLVGAQYILTGKAMVHNSGEAIAGSDFKSLHASLQLKIIQSHTGLVLGSVVQQAVAAHISELAGATTALQKASRRAVEDYIADTIDASFRDFAEKGLPFKLYVTGVTSYSQSREVTAYLESLDQVVSCRSEGWNRAGGLLVLDLRYRGNMETLADHLDRRHLGKGYLMVEDVAVDRLDLALVVL